MGNHKTILVAPLNWGLGHATRSIPIIRELLAQSFKVIIASDGDSLKLLRKEFPKLDHIALPSYQIRYPKKGKDFKKSLLLNLPKINKAINAELKIIDTLVSEEKIDGIISDNRLGVRNKKVPSVIITHQLKVPTGATTFLSSKLHQHYLSKFTECWVPDVDSEINLSGELGHIGAVSFPVKYIGPLSRMRKKDLPKKYDVLALLSGPEPQRSFLSEHLVKTFYKQDLSVLLVEGIIEKTTTCVQKKNITVVNFMESAPLEKVINESDIVIARSGYTTIMDLAAMKKRAFFIPTPGQFEQEYLAKRLQDLTLVPYTTQEKFSMLDLERTPNYKGLSPLSGHTNFKQLFSLF